MKKTTIVLASFFLILLPSKIYSSKIDSSKLTLYPDPFPTTLGKNFATSKKAWGQGKARIEIYSQNQAIVCVAGKQPKSFLQNSDSALNQFRDRLVLPGQCRSPKERTWT